MGINFLIKFDVCIKPAFQGTKLQTPWLNELKLMLFHRARQLIDVDLNVKWLNFDVGILNVICRKVLANCMHFPIIYMLCNYQTTYIAVETRFWRCTTKATFRGIRDYALNCSYLIAYNSMEHHHPRNPNT